MKLYLGAFKSWLLSTWEKLIFSLFGMYLLAFGAFQLTRENTALAITSLAFGIFSFAFGSIAKFKKFKGFGIEAELWEDKQKEASELIDRLRDVIQVYANEIIIAKVRTNRLGSHPTWSEIIQTYVSILDDKSLSGKIELNKARDEINTYFIFDCASYANRIIDRARQTAASAARDAIDLAHPSPIADSQGHGQMHAHLREAIGERLDLKSLAQSRCCGETLKINLMLLRRKFKSHFDIDVDFDENVGILLEEICLMEKETGIFVNESRIALFHLNREE
ncbi:MAG: hypothetical protein K2X45_11485 [Phreatobacter sp.]|nr:hypothetical protein [Phreatobacter sp.]